MSAVDLYPIDPSLVPFQVGEKVAFAEDHSEHPGMYGLIQAIGLVDGHLMLDVLVFDPFTGVTGDETTIRRVAVREGELQ